MRYGAMPVEHPMGMAATFRALPMVTPDLAVPEAATSGRRRVNDHRYGRFIVAAATAGCCDLLCSEDLPPKRVTNEVRKVNPSGELA